MVSKRVEQESVREFAQQAIAPVPTLHADELAAFGVLTVKHRHVA